MSFWHKAGADAGERFGGSDNQKTVIGKAVSDPVEQLFPVFQGEIDGDIPAENDVEFAKGGKRGHEVQFPEVDHSPDFVLDLPRVAEEAEISLQVTLVEASLYFELIIFPIACL
jgi:hypothetical protein